MLACRELWGKRESETLGFHKAAAASTRLLQWPGDQVALTVAAVLRTDLVKCQEGEAVPRGDGPSRCPSRNSVHLHPVLACDGY